MRANLASHLRPAALALELVKPAYESLLGLVLLVRVLDLHPDFRRLRPANPVCALDVVPRLRAL